MTNYNPLTFSDPRCVALWNCEILGQLSDGIYENYRRGNRAFWVEAKSGEDKCTISNWNYSIKRIYREMSSCDLIDRGIAYINCAELLNKSDWYQYRTAVEVLYDEMYDCYTKGIADIDRCAENVATHFDDSSMYKVGDSWQKYIYEKVREFAKSVNMNVKDIAKIAFCPENVNDRYNRKVYKEILEKIEGVVK